MAWGAAAGEDEIDITLDLATEKVFFELKDREFGLGDAYPFATRVSRYGADFGVVISTEAVGGEAKTFLSEPRQGVDLMMVEGHEHIESSVCAILNDISRADVLLAVGDALAVSGLNLRGLLERWMMRP
jgi:hypothetical protein